jgi:hypothetical protein
MTASSPSTSEAAGYRGAEAFIRPHPALAHGVITSHGFDLKSCTFQLQLISPSSTPADYPTEIFLPAFHFPRDHTAVEVSGGKWEIRTEEIVEGAAQQVLKWWHGEGEQKLTVKGVRRKRGQVDAGAEEDGEGYMEAYWQMGKNCVVM